jgi:hypothetical protein
MRGTSRERQSDRIAGNATSIRELHEAAGSE